MTCRRAVFAAAALLLLASCGGKSNRYAEPHTQPTPAVTTASPATAAPTPNAAEEYDGAQRLVGGLNQAGIACVNWERTEDPIGALERGSCYVGTEEVVTSIYASHEDAAAEPDVHADLLSGVDDVDMVVGGNWTLSCDTSQLCDEIEQKFGGEHVHIPA
jgi:hypothetical protein